MVLFATNTMVQTVAVVLVNDDVLEDDETFQGRLTAFPGDDTVMIGVDTATATIIDDDSKRKC